MTGRATRTFIRYCLPQRGISRSLKRFFPRDRARRGSRDRKRAIICYYTDTTIEIRDEGSTHHRCSGFSIGSSAWNPSCPSLAVARTTTASSSSSSALRLVLRRNDLALGRAIVSLLLSFYDGQDCRPVEIVIARWIPSDDTTSDDSRAHYLGGSIAVTARVTSPPDRSLVNRG